MEGIKRRLGITFLLLVFLNSAFYLLADFGKTLIINYGLLQAAVLLPSIIFFLTKNSRLFIFLACILVTMNLGPLFLWIIDEGAWFWLFGMPFISNTPLTLFHAAITLIGISEIFIIVKKMLNRKKESIPRVEY